MRVIAKPPKTESGFVGIIIVILVLITVGAWIVSRYINKHPETTEQVVPVNTVEQGSKAIDKAKTLQNSYQNPTTQY
ncbi:MAG TPA: hypothetical protein VLE72_01950 [Candidatus Saccharimonadales bacterium]|nr:hypothetical protein [Candidatus Saccharimonadales bacterium]